MKIKVFADTICGWCFIGHTRLLKATNRYVSYLKRFVNLDEGTIGGINEKTVSICIDPYQTKIPTDSSTDSTKIIC